MLLKALSDFERIGDHALNLVESAEELKSKNLALSDAPVMSCPFCCGLWRKSWT